MSRPFVLHARTLILALAFASAQLAGAKAADLYDDPPVRRGSAYDDPRYADIYGRAPPAPREHAYRYDDEPAPTAYGRPCPSKDDMSRRLERDGWGDFANPRVVDRDTATIDARRPNGRPFRLELDRCDGDILAARPLDEPRYGADAGRYSDDHYGHRRILRPY